MDKLLSELSDAIQKELLLLEQLEVVLTQETSALEKQNADDISEKSKEKQNLASELEQCGLERVAMLKQAGHEPGKEGIAALASADSSGKLEQLWRDLETSLLRCQKQNQVNGILLEKGRQQTQQLLNILLNEGEVNQADALYDASGSSTSSSLPNGRSIKV